MVIAKNKEKCIVMFSGGLDSRLAIKLMQDKGYEVLAVFFKLPFGTGCCDENCSFSFSQMQGVKLKIFDCSKGKLLKEYLEVIKQGKNGRGAGINPCMDCRIFMLKEVKKFADKEGIKIIATGEVLGQRPMSQMKRSMEIVENESGLKGRLLRPLSELGIKGRSRKKQMELAKKYKFSYPNPGGGCLLCEKALKQRFRLLLERGISDEEINFVGIGRHFFIDNCWIILGRNLKENTFLETSKVGKVIIPDFIGPSGLILDSKPLEKVSKIDIEEKVDKLLKAYSKEGSNEIEKNLINLKYKMCKICNLKPVYEFTNKRKVCKSCFVKYFEKKFLYIIRKFNMIDKNDRVYSNNKLLLYLFGLFADKGIIEITNNKKKANKIAVGDNIDINSEKIVKNLISSNDVIMSELSPVNGKVIMPLYLFSDSEINIYSNIKKIKISSRKKSKDKIVSFINELEKKHPEIKRAIVNSYLDF